MLRDMYPDAAYVTTDLWRARILAHHVQQSMLSLAMWAQRCVGAVTLCMDAVQCPLFARKLSNSTETVDTVMDVLHSCEQPASVIEPCANGRVA